MMRKTCLIIFVLLISVILGFSQSRRSKITIQNSEISVEEILREITRQSGLHFSYNPQSVDASQEIAFNVRKAKLEKTLDKLASIIPIEYTIVENQIVLNRLVLSGDIKQNVLSSYTISGYITDKHSGESLIGATIYARGTTSGAVTNNFGFYSLRLPEGKYILEFSFLGFSTEELELTLKKDVLHNIPLCEKPVELPDVLVEIPVHEILDKKKMGTQEIHPKDLQNIPEFGGESGLIKGLQAFPGIKTHSDGSAFFFVRGGEKDQNLIIIDDAPIYNPAHLFGFYSLVIPDFTKNIKLYKSDIPVNLGDRLSSIIDVRTKDGNLNRMKFSGAFNPLLYRFSLEGPVVKGKSSFFSTFRHSNFDWIYKKTVPDLDLHFRDFSFKWNYKINNNNRLFLTIISGEDDLANKGALSYNRAGIGCPVS